MKQAHEHERYEYPARHDEKPENRKLDTEHRTRNTGKHSLATRLPLADHRAMNRMRIGSPIGFVVLALALAFASLVAPCVEAQGISINSPAVSALDSFYSRTGIGFGFRMPGASGGRGVVGLSPTGQLTPDGAIYFGQGSWNSALPPFGGYDPQSDARLGFRVGGNSGPGFSLGLVAGRGSSRSIVGTAPSLTIPNGGSGYLFDGRWTPFVTGWTPIVGGRARYVVPIAPPTYVHPLQWKLQQLQQQALADSPADLDSEATGRSAPEPEDSAPEDSASLELETDIAHSSSAAIPRADSSTAAQPAASVAQLRVVRAQQVALQQREHAAKISALLQAAEEAVANGFPGSARNKLRQALRLADESQKAEIQRRLDQLKPGP